MVSFNKINLHLWYIPVSIESYSIIYIKSYQFIFMLICMPIFEVLYFYCFKNPVQRTGYKLAIHKSRSLFLQLRRCCHIKKKDHFKNSHIYSLSLKKPHGTPFRESSLLSSVFFDCRIG